jgi:AcrR family transcriptional regulator
MTVEERPLRADAERNRRRLLAAAAQLFREQGLDVGVAEIAQCAGVGRATLFRNFPTKEDLIAAIVVERVREAIAIGTELLSREDAGEALFGFLDDLAGRQELDRALFEAVGDEWLSNEAIRDAHTRILGLLGELLHRAQDQGTIRADVSAIDVLMQLKGVCETANAFRHLGSDIVQRQLDLMRAGLRASADQEPLRGRSPTLAEIEACREPPRRGGRRTSPRS